MRLLQAKIVSAAIGIVALLIFSCPRQSTFLFRMDSAFAVVSAWIPHTIGTRMSWHTVLRLPPWRRPGHWKSYQRNTVCVFLSGVVATVLFATTVYLCASIGLLLVVNVPGAHVFAKLAQTPINVLALIACSWLPPCNLSTLAFRSQRSAIQPRGATTRPRICRANFRHTTSQRATFGRWWLRSVRLGVFGLWLQTSSNHAPKGTTKTLLQYGLTSGITLALCTFARLEFCVLLWPTRRALNWLSFCTG